ncbi:MAG: hypothetical protein QNK34_01160 [Woeseiaceae bacterium]|nr:hypothetical protein [Woeseiaceae bacterium]
MTKSLYRDRSRPSATTFLLSSGRSGSTWLGSMLHSLPGTRMIFEPFHARRGIPSLSEFRYTYIAPESATAPVLTDIKKLLSKSSWNPWIEQFNPVGRFMYRRRLVKEVRINLLLPLLLRQLSECRFLLLLRHPAAVVQSQVSGGWLLSPERLFQQRALDGLSWLRDLQSIELSNDPFEHNLVFWAIENRIALDAARTAGIPILFYEELCMEPAAQLAPLEIFLGASFPASATKGATGASWSSSKAVAGYSLEQKISAWQTHIRPRQITAMLRILEASGLDRVYGRDPLPDSSLPR